MRLITINILLFSFFVVATASYGQHKLNPKSFRDLDSISIVNELRRAGNANIQHPFINNRKRIEHYFRNAVQNWNQINTGQICFDTSERFFIKNDTITYYPRTPFRTKDGNLLIAGEYATYNPNTGIHSGGALMKVDEDGTILWSRLYDSIGAKTPWYLYYYRVIELADGSIIMAGGINNNTANNDDFVVTKTTSTGQIIWSKTFTSRFWTMGHGSADYYRLQQIKQDPYTGDIYLCGTYWTTGKGILKLDQASGNIIWAKSYQQYSAGAFDEPFGMDIKPNEIIYFGRSLNYQRTLMSAFRINKNTGEPLQTKFYETADTSLIKPDILRMEELKVLNNGHYILSGSCYGQFIYNWNGVDTFYQASVMEFDNALNFVKAYTFRNAIQNNGYNTKVTVYPDGSGIFSMLEYFGGYTANVYYIQFKDGLILKQRRRFYSGEGMPWENNAVKAKDGGDLIVKLLGDSATNINKIEFLKLHISDTSSSCLGFDNGNTFLQPFNVIGAPGGLDSARDKAFQESIQQTITELDNQLSRTPACFQISYCDSLKLIPSDTVLCYGNNLTLTVRKNKACGTMVPLAFDTSAINKVIQLNDSTFTFSFRKPWTGYIGGSLQGCTLMKDSVRIKVLQSPGPVSLGPDSSLCPSNTILLNAHSGYASYKWQDGKTDSVYTVTSPGKYYITVKDACGGTLSDTININPAPPVPISIGPDRTKCNNDTLKLNAPSGFLNYSWSPNYNVSSITAQDVIINPVSDTTYYIKAEKTPGCFGFDTIRIKVNTSPVINLGKDTALCGIDSIILNAGTGFTSYQWNGNNGTQKLVVKQKGDYTIKAITLQGCISSDTIKIDAVNKIPISIGPSSLRCNDDILQYTMPAGFVSFQWLPAYNLSYSGGLNVNVYPVIDTEYYIKGENAPGCFSYDTLRVKVSSSPSINLGKDTSFCSGDSIILNAGTGFTSYIWNGNTGTQKFTAKQKGDYIVKATTAQGCISADTLTVLNLFANPVVQLNQDTALCIGNSKVLDAGNFAAYLWNNGNTSRTISITDVGTYTVAVTDNNGCKGSGSSYLKKILPLPAKFLPKDTTICSYGDITLEALQNYNAYLWSNNSRSSSIKVTSPGIYWLQVTDKNNCVGNDSILVILKDCMLGFYIPTAFTPNNDGLNDIFRPLVFGNIKQYNFTVYNRWGEVIFKSNQPGTGWDGVIKGTEEKTGIYIWTCTYQLEGEQAISKKGTVTLIK